MGPPVVAIHWAAYFMPGTIWRDVFLAERKLYILQECEVFFEPETQLAKPCRKADITIARMCPFFAPDTHFVVMCCFLCCRNTIRKTTLDKYMKCVWGSQKTTDSEKMRLWPKEWKHSGDGDVRLLNVVS